MACVKALLQSEIDSLDSRIGECDRTIEAETRWRESARAKRAELVEALAKLYPPKPERKAGMWDSLTRVNLKTKVIDFHGFSWKYNTDVYRWERFDEAGKFVFRKPQDSTDSDHLGPFVEVLDGDE